MRGAEDPPSDGCVTRRRVAAHPPNLPPGAICQRPALWTCNDCFRPGKLRADLGTIGSRVAVALGGRAIEKRNSGPSRAFMNGWLVKISGWAEPGSVRLFAAAESDPRLALVAVQKVTEAAPQLRVETVGPLSSRTIHQLGLEAGQTLDLTS